MRFAIKNSEYHVVNRGRYISVFKVFMADGKLRYIQTTDAHILRVARAVIKKERAA